MGRSLRSQELVRCAQAERKARRQFTTTFEPDGTRKICGCGEPFASKSSFFTSGNHHCYQCGVLVCKNCVTGEKGAWRCTPLDCVRVGCSKFYYARTTCRDDTQWFVL